VDAAQKKLEETFETFNETINSEIDDFEEFRDAHDVPCVLKDL